LDLARAAHTVTVRHAPFLRLDPVDDGAVATDSVRTIDTGGRVPQRYLSLTWCRQGPGGDDDADDDARISLYYSDAGDFEIPGGAEELEAAAADPASDTHLIVGGLREDPDERPDNQYVWDLWALADEGRAVPRAARTYYVYGVIADSVDHRLVQMNGGHQNDAGARLTFTHRPSLRPLQPLADIVVEAGLSGRVSWEDMDLDGDARIRVILSAEDHGGVATYDVVTTGTDFVVNSLDGRAQPAVDPAHDLSEDSATDYLDVRADHLRRSINGESPPQAGDYYVYIAIEDGPSFGAGSLAWRTPGRLRLNSPSTSAARPTFAATPQVFTVGAGGGRQSLDLLVNAAGKAADMVVATLAVDGRHFSVVDQDSSRPGTQPFRVGATFSGAKLVTNRLETAADSTVYLHLEYFDPTVTTIANLAGLVPLASCQLEARGLEDSALQVAATVQLVADPASGRPSQLERKGAVAAAGQAGVLSTGTVVGGRARLRGRIALEGRLNRGVLVDVDVRPRGDYRPLADSLFAVANDRDPALAGVQVQLEPDGRFELQQVPVGRVDLYAHLDGYLDAWTAGLELFPSQTVEGLLPTSTGAAGDSLMLGGDVAGYTGTDRVSRPDNEITLADWDFVASVFDQAMAAGSDSARADINGDGTVNVRDLTLVGANFAARGPSPVYRAAAGDGAAVEASGQFRGSAAPVRGQSATFAVQLEGSGAVRSYQLDLLYDPVQWTVLAAHHPVAAALAAHRQHDWGQRWAATMQGRDAVLAAVDPAAPAVVVAWELVALVDGPVLPRLGQALWLDPWDRPIPPVAGGATAVAEPMSARPARLALAQNHPNPFNPHTTIGFAVPDLAGASAPRIRVEVYNALGQEVAVLLDAPLPPGTHEVTWDGRDTSGRPVASGLYFCRLVAAGTGAAPLTRRMVLLR
ncbi:MAG: FlgD immunoglobulin-like domain containing protein, partial [Gemmatimonadota bacterium]